eukprot:5170330-Pleurochrysis_carterae.AAC.1
MLRRSCHRALTLPPDGRSSFLRSVHTPLLAAPRRGVCKTLACACLLCVLHRRRAHASPRVRAHARRKARARNRHVRAGCVLLSTALHSTLPLRRPSCAAVRR